MKFTCGLDNPNLFQYHAAGIQSRKCPKGTNWHKLAKPSKRHKLAKTGTNHPKGTNQSKKNSRGTNKGTNQNVHKPSKRHKLAQTVQKAQTGTTIKKAQTKAKKRSLGIN